MKIISKKRLIGLLFTSLGFAQAQSQPPDVPIPGDLQILLEKNGIMAEIPVPNALAKGSSWRGGLRFVSS